MPTMWKQEDSVRSRKKEVSRLWIRMERTSTKEDSEEGQSQIHLMHACLREE